VQGTKQVPENPLEEENGACPHPILKRAGKIRKAAN